MKFCLVHRKSDCPWSEPKACHVLDIECPGCTVMGERADRLQTGIFKVMRLLQDQKPNDALAHLRQLLSG